jgi:hypothetical protein
MDEDRAVAIYLETTKPTHPSYYTPSYVNHKGTLQTIEELCQHYESPPQSRPTSPTEDQTLLISKTTSEEFMRLFEEALDELAHQGQDGSHNIRWTIYLPYEIIGTTLSTMILSPLSTSALTPYTT